MLFSPPLCCPEPHANRDKAKDKRSEKKGQIGRGFRTAHGRRQDAQGPKRYLSNVLRPDCPRFPLRFEHVLKVCQHRSCVAVVGGPGDSSIPQRHHDPAYRQAD